MKIISVAAAIALAVVAVGARQVVPQATGPNVARDLRGAIDIHVHANPDNVPRSLDGLEAARFAKARHPADIIEIVDLTTGEKIMILPDGRTG